MGHVLHCDGERAMHPRQAGPAEGLVRSAPGASQPGRVWDLPADQGARGFPDITETQGGGDKVGDVVGGEGEGKVTFSQQMLPTE